jgi:hypothetical protein
MNETRVLVRGRRGAALIDVVAGAALLSILALAAGRVAMSGTDLIRAHAGSAQATVEVGEALDALARDVAEARDLRCTGATLDLVLADGRTVSYDSRESGLVRAEGRDEGQEWPRLQAEFEASGTGLVDVHLTAERVRGRAPLSCESAFWARASSQRRSQ